MTSDSVDPAAFRQLLGAFASGVTVITARDPAGLPAGMTASAFSALSLDPPLMLVCIGLESGFHGVIRAAERFAVNILAVGQASLSERFAGTWSDRFTGVTLAPDAGDHPPILGGTAAHLICETVRVLPGGDHEIFVARVLGGAVSDRAPLVRFRGQYRELMD